MEDQLGNLWWLGAVLSLHKDININAIATKLSQLQLNIVIIYLQLIKKMLKRQNSKTTSWALKNYNIQN